jgi:hypothetical protein
MTPRSAIVPAALFVLAALAHWWWRYRAARVAAEGWLEKHRYRARELRASLLNTATFSRSIWRDDDNAFEFRAVVDDLRLGGTGVVFLRVRTDWLGMIEREVDVNWERMPHRGPGDVEPAEDRWASAQLALLRRVGAGESTLRPAGRTPADGAAFDELVEHLMALERRGLVECSTPIAELHGRSQYAAVTDVVLTPDGRALLARRENED